MDRSQIIATLDRHDVRHWMVEHPPAETTEAADAFIEGHEGVRTKSLFLVNRKKNRSYLVVMDDQKPLDLAALAEQLGESRLSLGSPERLQAAIGLEPGVVSPFGLLDPEHREPRLFFDEEMLREPILTFHPSDNRATIFLATQDLLRLLTAEGVDHQVIPL